ncbi:uncharacterized protein LOC135957492 [Calliphora vicina]|uniref:uncharacterized protein LOC135957492 n=1 Tax=Calliphora vicina TaxID=7373 RepID=UPI00325B01C1
MLSECKSNSSCLKCYLKHHTLRHKEVNTSEPESTNRSDDIPSVSGNNTTVQSCFATTSKNILLGTAMVNISQTSFISHKLQNSLNLTTRATNVCISALNDSTPGPALRECDLTLGSPIDRGFKLNMSAFVLPKLTGNLPNEYIDVSNLSFSLDFQLADPSFSTSGSVDILIGADFYPKIMSDGSRQKVIGDMIAHESHFGWILFGPVPSSRNKSTIRTFFSKLGSNKHIKNRLEHFESPDAQRISQVKNSTNKNRTEWRKDFIRNIQQCNRFVHHNLKVDDMVLYRDDNFSINKWHLGHVVKVYMGENDNKRLAELKTDRGLTTIPAEKLLVLPTH